jgi:hypothetical protein
VLGLNLFSPTIQLDRTSAALRGQQTASRLVAAVFARSPSLRERETMVIAFAFLTDRTDGVHPLLRLISLNAGQQFFFQPGPALLEPLNFRLVASFRLITLKKVDDVAVLVTKRVETLVRRR